ncbi:hypothetical protein NQ315_017582, partial [Exocentrus adspersus]
MSIFFGEKRPAKKKCCVPGCDDKDSSRFRFPNKNQQYLVSQWLQRINNVKLNTMPFEKLYINCVVCARHFLAEQLQFGCRRGLSQMLYHFYFLTKVDQQILPSVPVHQHEATPRPETTVSSVNTRVNDVEVQSSSPITPCNPGGSNMECVITEYEWINLSVSYVSTNYAKCALEQHEATPSATPRPETTDSRDNTRGKEVEVQSSIVIPITPSNTGFKRSTILKDIKVTRQKCLSPKSKHLYKKAAEKLAKSDNFHSLMNHVNPLTYKFIMSQIRTQFQKPKARRYTIDEKILALTILKASGKGTSVKKMKKHDRLAILVFDEISINTLIHYNSKNDMVEGIQDNGNGNRERKIADYANVFMLKGVFRQWKQPICYTFNSGPTKSTTLKRLIIDIIKECHSIGLEIIATICDQGGPNQAAINSLLQDTTKWCLQKNVDKCFGFIVDGKEIVPLYDTPHLIKGIRNNLLTKDLHFEIDNKNCVAKWHHLEQFYLLDIGDPEKICPKLTDGHILRGKINKMKVKCCTQVFSQSQVNLDPGAIDTSTLILFLDTLFDSLNSSQKSGPPGKPLKASVTSESDHITFWYKCIKVFKGMRFYAHKQKKFIYIQKKFILLRVFQQDALENFFGCIRNYSGRENNPSAAHFLTSYKALLINNFLSSHSPGSNCEVDQAEGALDTFRHFITNETLEDATTVLDQDETHLEIPSALISSRKSKISRCTVTYISGFILRRLFKKINNCDESWDILYIFNKSGHKTFILYYSENIELNFKIINFSCHRENSTILSKLIVRCCLFFWCKRVNAIAKGKDDKFEKYLKMKPQESLIDPIQLQAYKKYE